MNKLNIIKIIVITICFVVCGCVIPPSNKDANWYATQQNACLAAAIVFSKGLEQHGVWSKVMITDNKTSKGTKIGHAVCVYLYPAGKNSLWVYDFSGSTKVNAYTNDCVGIANKAWFWKNYDWDCYNASYLEK